jgi:streptogramin lyase
VGVAVGADGTVYVADLGNDRVRAIDPVTGVVSTLAGTGEEGFADGPGNDAKFAAPYSVAVGTDGTLYVADSHNFKIRAINPTNGVVSTLAGSGLVGSDDGPGSAATFWFPTGVGVGPNGTVYVADTSSQRIRAINPTTGEVSTLAGSSQGFAEGSGAAAQFNRPSGVSVGADGTVYVADSDNSRIRKIT